jgi:hypothetical protein
MQASNFLLQSSIYLVVGDARLDLHNDYDFVAVEYNVASQTVKLAWQRASGAWVAGNPPLRLTLEFAEVTYFESIPGDFSLPKSESFCLSSFGYCTDEDWGKSQFWVERVPEPDWAWSFQFQSKQEFRIRGAHASIKVEH